MDLKRFSSQPGHAAAQQPTHGTTPPPLPTPPMRFPETEGQPASGVAPQFHEGQVTVSSPKSESGKRLYPVSQDPKPAAIVVHCSDPRFQGAFEEFLEQELHLPKGGYIPIVVGGGAGVLGHPEQLPKEFKFLKERLEHYRQIFPTAHRIILINHEGCRYYQNLKSRALAMIGSRLHLPLDLGRDDLGLVAESFRHFLSHLGYSVELYYAKFSNPEHTHIEIEKVSA